MTIATALATARVPGRPHSHVVVRHSSSDSNRHRQSTFLNEHPERPEVAHPGARVAAGVQTAWLRSDVIAGVTDRVGDHPQGDGLRHIGWPCRAVRSCTRPCCRWRRTRCSAARGISASARRRRSGSSTAAEVSELSPDGSQAVAIATTLAVLVGVILILAAVLRLGFVAQFISEPVLIGFKAGIGLVIIVDQAPKLLGLHLAQGIGAADRRSGWSRAFPHASHPTVVLAAVTIGAMLLISRYVPRAPSPLVAVVLGIAASGLLGLGAQGVATVGAIPSGLPGFTLPNRDLMLALWPGALGIALISFTESIAAGRAFARGGERPPDANQELLALGAGNAPRRSVQRDARGRRHVANGRQQLAPAPARRCRRWSRPRRRRWSSCFWRLSLR